MNTEGASGIGGVPRKKQRKMNKTENARSVYESCMHIMVET